MFKTFATAAVATFANAIQLTDESNLITDSHSMVINTDRYFENFDLDESENLNANEWLLA